MKINQKIIVKNINTFTNAYGVKFDSKRMLDHIINDIPHVQNIGVMLRDAKMKQEMLSCFFPINIDITNEMLWVPCVSAEVMKLEPLLAATMEETIPRRTSGWRKNNRLQEGSFYNITENNFTLRAHKSFLQNGPIENFNSATGTGSIRGRRRIFFKKSWCDLKEIHRGQEVSFLPVISLKGLQARTIEEIQ